MKSVFDKLNLRPQERRLVVIVGIVVFVVLNLVFVRPMFGEYGKTMQRRKDSLDKLKIYEREINRKRDYQKQKAQLENSGAVVAQEDQISQLLRDVEAQAGASQVTLGRR